MPDASVSTVNFPVTNNLNFSDSLVVLYTSNGVTNTCIVSLENALANSVFDLLVASGRNLILAGPATVPANSSSNGVKGTISWDASHLYVCVANNTWGRVNLSLSPSW